MTKALQILTILIVMQFGDGVKINSPLISVQTVFSVGFYTIAIFLLVIWLEPVSNKLNIPVRRRKK